MNHIFPTVFNKSFVQSKDKRNGSKGISFDPRQDRNANLINENKTKIYVFLAFNKTIYCYNIREKWHLQYKVDITGCSKL